MIALILNSKGDQEYCLPKSLIKGLVKRAKCVTIYLEEDTLYLVIENDEYRSQIYHAIADWFVSDGCESLVIELEESEGSGGD